MRSDKPSAVQFQDWIAEVVLPAIRKDGMYVKGEEKVATGELSIEEMTLKVMTALTMMRRSVHGGDMRPLAMIALWLVVGGSLLAVHGWSDKVAWMNANSGLASWIQGVGSIMAVAAGAWGIYWAQQRQDLRDAENETSRRREVLNTAFQLVHGVADTLRQIAEDSNGQPPVPIDVMTLQGQFDGLSHALRKLELTSFADYSVIEAVVTTDAVVRKMSLLTDAVLRPGVSIMMEWPGVIGEAVSAHAVVKKRAKLLYAAIKKASLGAC